MALADFVLTADERHLATIAGIDTWLLDQQKPDVFDDGAPGNVLTLHRQRFGKACAALAESGYHNAHTFSVFQFNSSVDYLLDKQQKAA